MSWAPTYRSAAAPPTKRPRLDGEASSDSWQLPAGFAAVPALLLQVASNPAAPLEPAEREHIRATHGILKELLSRPRQKETGDLPPAAKWGQVAQHQQNGGSQGWVPRCPPQPPPAHLLNQSEPPLKEASSNLSEQDDDEVVDDEETIMKKELIVERAVELLTDRGEAMSFSFFSNDHIVQTNKLPIKGWLGNTLRERADLFTFSDASSGCFNLLGLDPEPTAFVSPVSCVPPDDGSPLIVDPGNLAPKKLLSLYQNKMKVALDHGDITFAEKLVREARHRNNVAVNVQMLNWIILAHAKGKEPDKAAAWLDRMKHEYGVKPTERTFAHVLDGYTDLDRFAEADELLEKMEETYGVSPDIRCFNALIKMWCRSPEADPDMDIAEAWFDRAAASLTPDSFSFGNMIFGCWQRRNIQGVKDWFLNMLSHGVAPTVETCTWVFEAVASAPTEDRALALNIAKRTCQEMQRIGLRADNKCWKTLVKAVGERSAHELHGF